MRTYGALFVVFSVLALIWGLKLVVGVMGGPPTGSTISGGGEQRGGSRQDQIDALLSGDFKRAPKKNPDAGQGRLRCAVRAPDGAPAARARVQVTPCYPDASIVEEAPEFPHFWEAETDEAGLVEFRTLPAGSFIVFASRDGEHALAQIDVDEDASFYESILELWPNQPRKGAVLDEAGAPVAGARIVPVHASDWMGDSAPYRFVPTLTGDDGRFEHPLLPEGAWQLLVVAPGRSPQLITPDTGGEYRATLGSGETFSGRIMRENGTRPLGNTGVELTATDRPGERYTTRTNGQGYFKFDALRAAPYFLRLAPGDYLAAINVDVSPEQTAGIPAATPSARNMKIDPLTGEAIATDSSVQSAIDPVPAVNEPEVLQVVARAAGTIRGRVLEANAAIGVPGVRLAAYRTGDIAPASIAVSDQAGYYQLKSLEPAAYHLIAVRESGRVFTAEAGAENIVTEAGKIQTGPNFRAAPAVSLFGRVMDGDGAPVSEANVFVEIDGQPGPAMRFGADGSGTFKAHGLHGTDQVRVWGQKMGEKSGEFGPVTIGDSGLQDILLRIDNRR